MKKLNIQENWEAVQVRSGIKLVNKRSTLPKRAKPILQLKNYH